jgi:hypothetical protein
MENSKIEKILYNDSGTELFAVGFIVEEGKDTIRIAPSINSMGFEDIIEINKNHVISRVILKA